MKILDALRGRRSRGSEGGPEVETSSSDEHELPISGYDGLKEKEIADQLSLSYHTVDTHLRNIYAKLHVNTRSGAVAKALKERLF